MNSVRHARHYLSGLLGTQRRKNIEVIGLDVKSSDCQGLEQFISSSPWDHRTVIGSKKLARLGTKKSDPPVHPTGSTSVAHH